MAEVCAFEYIHPSEVRKVKFDLEEAKKDEVKLYSFFHFDARWGWVDNATHRLLYPGKIRCPLYRRLDGCGKSRLPGIRPPDHPAYSKSVYRLR